MGMYTELHFNAELRADVPAEVVTLLRAMVGDTDFPTSFPEHPLFSCDRWKGMLQSDSYYFAADTHSTMRYDDIGKAWMLCIRCNLKNYCQEIQKFIDWIEPYILAYEGDFLGFSRYEQTEEPTLIYYKKKEQ